MDKHEWLLKRNCSLSPRQTAFALAILCLILAAVALIFTLRGVWHVLVFAMLEMGMVALAYLHYARHATDHEHIALMDDCLLVERIQAGQIEQIRLDPHWTRIALPGSGQDLIRLEDRGIKIEVGRFVTEAKRRQVGQELRRELQVNASLHSHA